MPLLLLLLLLLLPISDTRASSLGHTFVCGSLGITEEIAVVASSLKDGAVRRLLTMRCRCCLQLASGEGVVKLGEKNSFLATVRLGRPVVVDVVIVGVFEDAKDGVGIEAGTTFAVGGRPRVPLGAGVVKAVDALLLVLFSEETSVSPSSSFFLPPL